MDPRYSTGFGCCLGRLWVEKGNDIPHRFFFVYSATSLSVYQDENDSRGLRGCSNGKENGQRTRIKIDSTPPLDMNKKYLQHTSATITASACDIPVTFDPIEK